MPTADSSIMGWGYSLVVEYLSVTREDLGSIHPRSTHAHTYTNQNRQNPLSNHDVFPQSSHVPRKPLQTVLKGCDADESGLAYRLKWISHPCFRKNYVSAIWTLK